MALFGRSAANMWGYRKVPRGAGGATLSDGEANTMRADAQQLQQHSAVLSSQWGRPIIIWSNDFHISTIATVKKLLRPRGVEFIDKSLSGSCGETSTCARDLRVLTSSNGISPSPDVVRRFADFYKADKEFQSTVDVVMCFHPAAMCELFMPLGKRLFVIATTRYEMGRETAVRWRAWNQNLLRIAQGEGNVVAANSLYDAEYIKYFTGITPLVLPSVTTMPVRYSGESNQVLLFPPHSTKTKALEAAALGVSDRVVRLRTKYPERYEYEQLCENTAVLHLPYQVCGGGLLSCVILS